MRGCRLKDLEEEVDARWRAARVAEDEKRLDSQKAQLRAIKQAGAAADKEDLQVNHATLTSYSQ